MEFKIVDFDEKYNDEVNSLVQETWGECDDEDISKSRNDKSFVRLALANETVEGVTFCNQIGDSFHINYIVISPKYQKCGIGTSFLKLIINEAISRECQTITCEVITLDNKANSKKLVENFGFEYLYTINNYYGSLYPDYVCPDCGNPCKCGAMFYVKKLKIDKSSKFKI